MKNLKRVCTVDLSDILPKIEKTFDNATKNGEYVGEEFAMAAGKIWVLYEIGAITKDEAEDLNAYFLDKGFNVLMEHSKLDDFLGITKDTVDADGFDWSKGGFVR